MAQRSQITSSTWTLGLSAAGSVVEGLDCIRQRMDLVYRTTMGTSALRPFFGSTIYTFQDRPANVSIPGIKAAIISATDMWLPEITLVSIKSYVREDFSLVFEITYNVIDADITDTLNLTVGSGTITTDVTQLVIQGLFPPDMAAHRLVATLVRNGNIVNPQVASAGIPDIDTLFAWILDNWGGYGRWLKGSDRIYLYANRELFTTGSLTIDTLAGTMYSVVIPELGLGQMYAVHLTADGLDIVTGGFTTPGDMLQWLQANWEAYGQWGVNTSTNGQTVGGDFSNEFNEDFDIGSEGNTATLMLFTELANVGLQINIIS